MTKINYIEKAKEYGTNTPIETAFAVLVNESVTLQHRGVYGIYHINVVGDYFNILLEKDHQLIPTKFNVKANIEDYKRWIRFISEELPF